MTVAPAAADAAVRCFLGFDYGTRRVGVCSINPELARRTLGAPRTSQASDAGPGEQAV